jgi:hypothetical protein
MASLAEPADADGVQRALGSAAHGAASVSEFRVLTPAGAYRRVSLSAIAVRDSDGAPGVLAIIRKAPPSPGAERPV